jgi:small subunit ribosomal protein S16
MSVRIRLRRMGRKKQPHYRVVVADGAAPRDGRIVENLGYYKPRSDPARLVLDLARFDYWVTQGAEPSETVRSLAVKARRGGTDNVALGEVDVAARKQRELDALATRRSAERKAAEAAAPAAAGGEEAPKKGKRKAKDVAEPSSEGASETE